MPEGVDHQVDEHALQERAVAARRRQVGPDRDPEPPPGLLGHRPVLARHLVHHLGEHDRLACDRHLPLLDLADLEEVLDEPHHLPAGALDVEQILPLRLGEIAALAQRELETSCRYSSRCATLASRSSNTTGFRR